MCALLLLAVIGMYYTGTAKLSEASIGTIQGEGVISFDVNGESLVLSSSWGLSTGFYLVVISFIFTILASALEFKSIFLGKRNS